MPFALFGIGKYAFAPWKVAVSGLHRSARFQVVGLFRGKPVFLDDTCYFLPFEDEAQARLVAGVLNSAPCQRFLQALIFTDSKRPITVELLQRLNLGAIADEAGYGGQWRRLQRANYTPASTASQFELVMESVKRVSNTPPTKALPQVRARWRRSRKPKESRGSAVAGTSVDKET